MGENVEKKILSYKIQGWANGCSHGLQLDTTTIHTMDDRADYE